MPKTKTCNRKEVWFQYIDAPKFYRRIIEDVIESSREDFDYYGVDHAVIEELCSLWERRVIESDVATFVQPDPAIPLELVTPNSKGASDVAKQDGPSSAAATAAAAAATTAAAATASRGEANHVGSDPNAKGGLGRTDGAQGTATAKPGHSPNPDFKLSVAAITSGIITTYQNHAQGNQMSTGSDTQSQKTPTTRAPGSSSSSTPFYPGSSVSSTPTGSNPFYPVAGAGSAAMQFLQAQRVETENQRKKMQQQTATEITEKTIESKAQAPAQAPAPAPAQAQSNAESEDPAVAKKERSAPPAGSIYNILSGPDIIPRKEKEHTNETDETSLGKSNANNVLVQVETEAKRRKTGAALEGSSKTEAAAHGSDTQDEITSDLDDSESDSDSDGENTNPNENIMLCLYEKVNRVKSKWRSQFRDGIVHIDNRDYIFSKANCEFQFT